MLAGLGAATAFNAVLRGGEALQDRFAARRDVAADIARFRERAPQVKDVDALLKDQRTLRTVLEAFQLETEIGKTAILRRLLTEQPGAEGTLSTRLTDQRWRRFAETFGGTGVAALSNPATIDRLAADAVTNRFEKAMGDANPGLREALYFRRLAADVTSVAQLMADRAMLEVTRGALGLPAQFGLLDYDQQRERVAKRLDVADLKDPRKVDRLVQRYLLQVAPATGASNPAPSLPGGGGNTASLASLPRGRFSFSI